MPSLLSLDIYCFSWDNASLGYILRKCSSLRTIKLVGGDREVSLDEEVALVVLGVDLITLPFVTQFVCREHPRLITSPLLRIISIPNAQVLDIAHFPSAIAHRLMATSSSQLHTLSLSYIYGNPQALLPLPSH